MVYARSGLPAAKVQLTLVRDPEGPENGGMGFLADTLAGVRTAAFADLSRMTGRRELFVQDVLHKAFIAVDETGTEATAATAVLVGRVSMPLEPVAMTVDAPFLFLICDVATGTVLFLGHVVNPARVWANSSGSWPTYGRLPSFCYPRARGGRRRACRA